ncbi:DivIVA domain-containing protein [Salinithrix halophila]|uniref:DivIVA domain-containing protein n=1 Tax=Salinithrix halophila TaxID=1485204 RepID=A0ABV8JCN0_9BACL
MQRLTPRDIFNKDFKTSLRGYDVDEVNEFLDVVIKNFEALLEENVDLKEQLKKERKSKTGRSAPQPLAGERTQEIHDIMRRLERLEQHILRR